MELKHIILAILFVTSGIFYYQLTDADSELIEVKITRVIDGDTVETYSGLKIRLKGINTPEKGMALSDESIEFLENVVLNKTIMIKSFGEDKYGRILGFLILDNENINAEILRRGLASLYYYEKDEFYSEMFDAEEFARINELGIWKKSENNKCLEIIEFRYEEPEILRLKNKCDFNIDILIKDDATHIYEEQIKSNDIFKLETSHIWNDAGDTLYVFDSKGLLIFERYI